MKAIRRNFNINKAMINHPTKNRVDRIKALVAKVDVETSEVLKKLNSRMNLRLEPRNSGLIRENSGEESDDCDEGIFVTVNQIGGQQRELNSLNVTITRHLNQKSSNKSLMQNEKKERLAAKVLSLLAEHP